MMMMMMMIMRRRRMKMMMITTATTTTTTTATTTIKLSQVTSESYTSPRKANRSLTYPTLAVSVDHLTSKF